MRGIGPSRYEQLNQTRARRLLGTTGSARLAQGYYLGTPLFLAVDAWGFNVRAAFLESLPVAKYAYYAICFVLGVVIVLRPRWATTIARVETTVNIAALIIGVMGSYYLAIEQLAAGGEVATPLSPSSVANLAIAAGVLIVTYVVQSVERKTELLADS